MQHIFTALPEHKNLRIVFIGTPDFAVASLKAICEAGYHVVGVITAPDKPAGRGMQLQESAVKRYAREKGLYIMQPPRLKNPEFLQELQNLKADLQVVIAFRMMPEVLWSMPRLGTFNLHASLLPQYRGAAPINWAIINGEKETGITTFFLKHEIDTGRIILQEKVSITEDMTAGELHDLLMEKGAAMVLRTLEKIESGDDGAYEQDLSASVKHAPKIFTEHCHIHWNQSAEQVHNLIRGMSPYPAAFSRLDGKILKIYKSSKELAAHKLQPGTLLSTDRKTLKVAVAGGYIHVLQLQLEGKKKMGAEEFLRGYRLEEGKVLG